MTRPERRQLVREFQRRRMTRQGAYYRKNRERILARLKANRESGLDEYTTPPELTFCDTSSGVGELFGPQLPEFTTMEEALNGSAWWHATKTARDRESAMRAESGWLQTKPEKLREETARRQQRKIFSLGRQRRIAPLA